MRKAQNCKLSITGKRKGYNVSVPFSTLIEVIGYAFKTSHEFELNSIFSNPVSKEKREMKITELRKS